MNSRFSGSKSKCRLWALDGGVCTFRSVIPFLGISCIVMLLFTSMTMWIRNQQAEMEREIRPLFYSEEELDHLHTVAEIYGTSGHESLPHGIVQATSDLELRPLWAAKSFRLLENKDTNRSLLAMPVGIKQKKNVDTIVEKFLLQNFTVILFHYDGNVNGWNDLQWHSKAIHIVANNQSKWWFAKRFLHPDIISIYDYVFIWDEDIGVDNFHPGRYLQIMKAEGLEISQPALDPDLSEVHHRITVRKKNGRVHRQIYGTFGSTKCSNTSEGPPCSGWVEGMAPVFSRAAWRCAWHLIQNDLVHGWGLDMKLGYCAQGDRTEKVGVIDSEYVVHIGIPTLGGPSRKYPDATAPGRPLVKVRRRPPVDVRVEIRRQSSAELEAFKQRWNQAVKEDKYWIDPYGHKPDSDKPGAAHRARAIPLRERARAMPIRARSGLTYRRYGPKQ
ncbi:uncharacterized protein LOC116264770 [Nymphaea colorata]|nr:uncharacterized protein LOC116264770 [Nymphaea colorata]XP_031501022.1 uncharacterized protein LOC116264770 [Nymphaea colorata]XP_031501030.1 uncharacterized protein LOC116264770 [Nymphaea colorata]XP_031501038.1 uncharacterized protein LOC116264770 [Nymphaea colorata]